MENKDLIKRYIKDMKKESLKTDAYIIAKKAELKKQNLINEAIEKFKYSCQCGITFYNRKEARQHACEWGGFLRDEIPKIDGSYDYDSDDNNDEALCRISHEDYKYWMFWVINDDNDCNECDLAIEIVKKKYKFCSWCNDIVKRFRKNGKCNNCVKNHSFICDVKRMHYYEFDRDGEIIFDDWVWSDFV